MFGHSRLHQRFQQALAAAHVRRSLRSSFSGLCGGPDQEGGPPPRPPGLREYREHFRAYYGSPSSLTFVAQGGFSGTVLSTMGVQQGDVWGPALFCAALHLLVGPVLGDIKWLGQVTAFCFADNIQLQGPVSLILEISHALSQSLEDGGLPLNSDESAAFVPAWSSLPDGGASLGGQCGGLLCCPVAVPVLPRWPQGGWQPHWDRRFLQVGPTTQG